MLVACDAKQLEWRVLLELSRDDVGIGEVLNGDDTHDLNRIAFSLPSRLIAKIYLFRTIYRGTGWSFANDPDFMHVSSDASFWDQVNEKFYNKYQGINNCHYAWKSTVEEGKPIEGPLGRLWDIPLLNKYGKVNWTQFTNYPVQGTAADVMAIARISFANRLKKLGWSQSGDGNGPVLLIQTVHDSIVCDCPEEYVQRVVNLFHEVFRDVRANILKIFKYEWVVPIDCECKYGMNQAKMLDIQHSLV
jgi:DNA polymerase I-like protein with 3'-5' exonuclease and polymerase domains